MEEKFTCFLCKDDFLYSEGKTFSCLCPRCPICIQDTQIILKERDSLTCQECNEYIRKDAIILPTISSLNYSLYSVWRANYSKWKRQLIKFENALEKNKDFPKESSIVLFNDIIIYYNEFISNLRKCLEFLIKIDYYHMTIFSHLNSSELIELTKTLPSVPDSCIPIILSNPNIFEYRYFHLDIINDNTLVVNFYNNIYMIISSEKVYFSSDFPKIPVSPYKLENKENKLIYYYEDEIIDQIDKVDYLRISAHTDDVHYCLYYSNFIGYVAYFYPDHKIVFQINQAKFYSIEAFNKKFHFLNHENGRPTSIDEFEHEEIIDNIDNIDNYRCFCFDTFLVINDTMNLTFINKNNNLNNN